MWAISLVGCPHHNGLLITAIFSKLITISMAQCKTVVSPLITHWRYHSLALSHRSMPHSLPMRVSYGMWFRSCKSALCWNLVVSVLCELWCYYRACVLPALYCMVVILMALHKSVVSPCPMYWRSYSLVLSNVELLSHHQGYCWCPATKQASGYQQPPWTIFIQENAFENIVCEIAASLSRPQCVNRTGTRPWSSLCLPCLST